MSRHSQVVQARKALQNAPHVRPTQEQQITIDQLVPMAIANGVTVQAKLQVNEPDKKIRLLSSCGPISIPVDFDPAKAREWGHHFLEAADKIDPPDNGAATEPEAELPYEPLSMEQALAEAEAALPPPKPSRIILPFA